MSLHRFEDDLELGIQEARVTMLTKKKKEIERRRSTVAQKISEDDVGALCAICSLDFEPGNKVNVFACHDTHMLHIKCFELMEKFSKKNKHNLTCPICREVIDKSKIVKKELLAADTKVQVYDPFEDTEGEVVQNFPPPMPL